MSAAAVVVEPLPFSSVWAHVAAQSSRRTAWQRTGLSPRQRATRAHQLGPRLPRGAEVDRRVIRAAVPAGSTRAADQGRFLRAVREHPEFSRLRADGWASLWAIARALAYRADWTLMITRPTWAQLATDTGRSRRTVARYLALLGEAGLIGVVATGRSSARGPAALHGAGADAAVYVLCTPSPLQEVTTDLTPAPVGDTSGTPTTKSVHDVNPQHARAREKTDAVSLRDRSCAAAPRPDVLATLRQHRGGSPQVTQRRPDDKRTAFALELQRALPPLWAISTRHVAAIIREFVLAGWTIRDLQRAVDERPDGTFWNHDGGTGINNVGAWLTYRLTPWRHETGTVRTSPSQRAQRAATEARARQRAAAEAATNTPTTPAAMPAELRAQIDALRFSGRGRRYLAQVSPEAVSRSVPDGGSSQ